MKPEDQKKLVDAATVARENAYAPYSNFKVGAALLSKNGKITTGVNVENAAYPSGLCAERVAYFKAASEGEREFEAIAIVTSTGGYPCGGCRQVMAEFGLDVKIIIAKDNGEILDVTTLRALLPEAFTPDSLK